MNPVTQAILGAKRGQIADLCQQHGVARLEIFGSATGEGFKTGQRDFDFLARFQPEPPQGPADSYLGLAEGLEKLLGRPVDLVTSGSLHNPYFRRNVEASRQLVYEHHGEEVVV